MRRIFSKRIVCALAMVAGATVALALALLLLVFRQGQGSVLHSGQRADDVVSMVDNTGPRGDEDPQPLFETNALRSNKGFNTSTAVTVDDERRLYVADGDNRRVLVYEFGSRIPLEPPIGQPNSRGPLVTSPVSASILGRATGIAYGDGWLFVSDASHNRVLVFAVSAAGPARTASHVLGQMDFTSSFRGSAPNRLADPYGLAYEAQSHLLYVADRGNSRVLVFDVSTVENGESAVDVAGLESLGGPRPTDARRLNFPDGVALDTVAGILFIADTLHNRVIALHSRIRLSDQQPAWTIGQRLRTAGLPETTTFNTPRGVAVDSRNRRLWVADSVNRRILGFDLPEEFPVTDSDDALAVSVLCKQNYQTWFAAIPGRNFPTRTNCTEPLQQLFFDQATNRLYGAENRVVVFDMNGPPEDGAPLADAYGVNVADMSAAFFIKNRDHDQPNDTFFAAPKTALFVQRGADDFLLMPTDDRIAAIRTTRAGQVGGTAFPRKISFVIGKRTTYQPYTIDAFISSTLFGFDPITAHTLGTSPKGNPQGLAYDRRRNWLFVSDTARNRVLAFQPLAFENFQAATSAWGVRDFVTIGGGAPTAQSLKTPHGLAYDPVHERLFVADEGNNRVLLYDLSDAPVAAQSESEEELITSTEDPPGAEERHQEEESPIVLSFPTGGGAAAIAGAMVPRLGEPAIDVLGQPGFESSSPSSEPTGMDGPSGLALDSRNQRLFVADATNHRVLVFNVAPDHLATAPLPYEPLQIIGAGPGLGCNAFNTPLGLDFDDVYQRLYVADTGNNRVLRFQSLPDGTLAEDADLVLGQPDCLTSAILGGERSDDRTFLSPEGVHIVPGNNMLYVADTGNNRVLFYEGL